MDFEEMNRRAAKREKTPEGLTAAERTIYLALTLAHVLYRQRVISHAEAVRLKAGFAQDLARLRKRETQWALAETVLKLLRRQEDAAVREAVRQAEAACGYAEKGP